MARKKEEGEEEKRSKKKKKLGEYELVDRKVERERKYRMRRGFSRRK